ncbi:hypothetical protein BDV06DRAFT_199364 [Aspergillus oleicola]
MACSGVSTIRETSPFSHPLDSGLSMSRYRSPGSQSHYRDAWPSDHRQEPVPTVSPTSPGFQPSESYIWKDLP